MIKKIKYDTQGFKITDYHGYNELNIKTLETPLPPGLLHIYENKEHIGIIEGSICIIKEHKRETWHAVPFKIYTSIIKRPLIEVLIELMNRLPYKDRVYGTLIPSKIVERGPKVDMGQKNIAFGSYVMVQIGINTTMKSIYVPEIELKVSNNSGGYYFLNILTGKQLHR